MRRAYGSDLPDIIDQPINPSTTIDVFQAVAEALQDWEPRIDLKRVQVTKASAGSVEITLDYEYVDTATNVTSNIEVTL